MINTSSLQHTAMRNVCWAAGFALGIANSLSERRQNQICASYCYVDTKEHQRSYSTLPLPWQLRFWVWRHLLGGYTGTIHCVFSLHLTKLASAPVKVGVFCHGFLVGASLSLGLVLVLFVKVFFKLFSKQTLDSFFSCPLSPGMVCLLQNI